MLSRMNFRFVIPFLIILPMAFAGCSPLTGLVQSDLVFESDRETNDNISLIFGKARLQEKKGLLAEAREAYQRILESDPGHVPSLHRLGVIAAQFDQIDVAMEYLNRAAGIAKPSQDLLGDLSYVQFLAGDLEGAEATCLEALKFDPANHRITNNLGMALGYQGRISESLDVFRRVTSEAEALNNVGFILSQTNQPEEAKSYFQRALDLDPNLKQSANGLVEIFQFQRAEQ